MNKRKRKKWLKKNGKYVSNRELWNLDQTICDWIIPRLKQFKEINIAYPGTASMDTPEKWDEALDKMIRAFELAKLDPIDLDENLQLRDYELEGYLYDVNKYKGIYEKRNAEVQEGLHLFATYFNDLWI